VAAGADTADPACNVLGLKDRTPADHTFKETRRFNDLKLTGFKPSLFDIDDNIPVTFHTGQVFDIDINVSF
jgi:hypothetical protein